MTGLDTSVKPFIDGTQNENRFCLVNSRNRNRKIIRSGATVTTQYLGIFAPTAAPTGSGGTGTTFYYMYVYVSHTFPDPLALDPDPFIRSDSSPVSAAIASGTTPATIVGAISTDPQVTHVWLYMSTAAAGPFFRMATGYEVANTGTPTWTSTTTVDVTAPALEIDNAPPDTCRIGVESNGFYSYAGFVTLATTASATIGSSTVTGVAFPDGIIALNLQFVGDTTGGPDNTGIHIAVWVNSTTLNLVNVDGTLRNYDGPSNKTSASVNIWRLPSVIQISKRYNPDFTPGIVDPNFLIHGPGSVTGIAKPGSGFAIRYHYNNSGKKSVEIADFAEGVPPRRFQTTNIYSMSNPRAYVAAGSRMFYYDYNAGVIEDRGSVHIPITLPVIPNLIRSLNSISADISEMEYDESRNLLFLSVAPNGYGRSYYMIVYNLTTNSWNLWFMLPDVMAMRRIKDPTTGNIVIKMGSSQGSYTVWPSVNFNEAVGTSIFGSDITTDDSTHLTVSGTPFPASGDKLKDRWIMTWNDSNDVPVYQFARISDNTTSRLTLDTFIGPNSVSGWSPTPSAGDNYWVGPIQSILGPNWDYNSVPDDDGHVLDFSISTSGLLTTQNTRMELYRNFEQTPITGFPMIHNKYNDQSIDPDHQSYKLGSQKSIEAVGVTGWKVVDNNEAGLSIKSLIKRVRAITQEQTRK